MVLYLRWGWVKKLEGVVVKVTVIFSLEIVDVSLNSPLRTIQ